jgi:hypothetical protein
MWCAVCVQGVVSIIPCLDAMLGQVLNFNQSIAKLPDGVCELCICPLQEGCVL